MATTQRKRSTLGQWVFRAEQAMADRRLRVREPGELPAPLAREPGDESAPLLCKAVFEEVCILGNGDVVCSCADSVGLRVYGNVRKQPLGEILAGPMYSEIRAWQLESKPDRWCPVLSEECPLRITRATKLDTVEGRLPKMLQLEPTSHCNLKCPACPVTEFQTDPRFAADRTGMLSLDEVTSIFEALPSLEKVLFYNYGEAFVHPEALPMLRWIRDHRPEMVVHISTNGIALTPARIRAVVGERLVDRMLFAIDGARPASYARYRVGGKLDRALGAMRGMVAETERHGVREQVEIWWQYILFEWNDSDAEIAEAHAIAAEIGVPIEWVVTHTPGASQRFLPGSRELDALVGGEMAFRALSCDLKGAEIVRDGGYEAIRHRASLQPSVQSIRGRAEEPVLIPVRVRHEGLKAWESFETGGYRLGVRLLDRTGKALGERRGVLLPPGLAPGEEATLFVELTLPTAGHYELFLDVVEEQVCWFSDRGSTPAIVSIEVTEDSAESDSAADHTHGHQHASNLVGPALDLLRRSELSLDTATLERKLNEGVAMEDLFTELRNSGELPKPVELELRSRLGEALPG